MKEKLHYRVRTFMVPAPSYRHKAPPHELCLPQVAWHDSDGMSQGREVLPIDIGECMGVVLESVSQAVRLCQRVQENVAADALEKRDKSPVTLADFGSQAVVARALANAYPEIPLIAEEDADELRRPEHANTLQAVVDHVQDVLGRQSTAKDVCAWIDHGSACSFSDLFWTLDPIDGTKGFLRKGQYAIALALMWNGKPVLAALACPNLPNPDGSSGAIFTTARGGEATFTTLEGKTGAVSVSREGATPKARFCESVESGHSDHSWSESVATELGVTAPSVRMDSQAKYAAVARGDAEIYLRLPTRPGYIERIWDHAAGVAILEAAGGQVTDIDGRELDFTHGRGLEKNRGIVATNGLVHDRVLAAIALQAT